MATLGGSRTTVFGLPITPVTPPTPQPVTPTPVTETFWQKYGMYVVIGGVIAFVLYNR